MDYKMVLFIAVVTILIIFISPITLISISGSSMYPTVTDGSLQPMYQTNSAEVNDIIVYYSPHTDSVITHRVVESTSEGFITQGDNNQVTDQEAGHPPVQNEDIIGKSINIGEQPIYIPYLGSILSLLQTNPFWFFFIIGGSLLLSSALIEKARTRSDVGVLTYSDIFQPIFITVIVAVTIIILVSSTTLSISFVFTNSDSISERPNVFSIYDENPSETLTIEHESNFGTQIYYSPDFTILEVSQNDGITELNIDIEQRNTPGSESAQLHVYTFPPILPENILFTLTSLSPVLSGFISSIISISPFYLVYRVYITPHRPVSQPRNRSLNRLYKKYIK